MKAQWPNKELVFIGEKDNEITVEQWNSLELLQQRHNLPDPVEYVHRGRTRRTHTYLGSTHTIG